MRTATAWSCEETSSSFLGRLNVSMRFYCGDGLFLDPGDLSGSEVRVCFCAWFAVEYRHFCDDCSLCRQIYRLPDVVTRR